MLSEEITPPAARIRWKLGPNHEGTFGSRLDAGRLTRQLSLTVDGSSHPDPVRCPLTSSRRTDGPRQTNEVILRGETDPPAPGEGLEPAPGKNRSRQADSGGVERERRRSPRPPEPVRPPRPRTDKPNRPAGKLEETKRTLRRITRVPRPRRTGGGGEGWRARSHREQRPEAAEGERQGPAARPRSNEKDRDRYQPGCRGTGSLRNRASGNREGGARAGSG